MRAFLLALALGLPFTLAGCAESPQEEAVEEGAPAGDMEDVIGDGEIVDEPGEPEGNMMDDGSMMEDSTTMDDGMTADTTTAM
jgi:hypothetical protein